MDFFSTEGSCHLLASWIGFIPLSPHRDRGWLDVHIWPRGCSPRRSLFNNTVPGLSWLGWWAQPPPAATLSTLIFNKAVHAVTTGHRSIINTNKNCCQTLLLLLKWWLPIMLFDTTTVIKPLHHNNYTDTANIMTSITSIPALVIHRELLLIVHYYP